MKTPFKLKFLDHVALRVKDLEQSADWYEKVLGLTRYEVPEWGNFPVFLLAGKTGVALFPVRAGEIPEENKRKGAIIDHFAFQLSNEDFEKAKAWCSELQIPYEIQDHHHFFSLYMRDPDDHTVELTTLIGKAEDFYG
ncbi:VOC family protein [Flavobacteriaceae bacterium D16]|nr:VOC family protein [Flavobacteriaceae bacterium D16]